MSAVLVVLNLGAGAGVQAASPVCRVLEGKSVLPHANQYLPSCVSSCAEDLCCLAIPPYILQAEHSCPPAPR